VDGGSMPRLLPSYLRLMKKIKAHELPMSVLQEYRQSLDVLMQMCELCKDAPEASTELIKINQIHHKVVNLVKQQEEQLKAKERKKIQTKLNQFAAAQTKFVALRVTEKQFVDLPQMQYEKEDILLEGQKLFQKGQYTQAIELYDQIPHPNVNKISILPIQAMVSKADCYATLAQFSANEQAKELEQEYITKAKNIYKMADSFCNIILKAESNEFSERDKTVAEAIKSNLFKDELAPPLQEPDELSAQRTIEDKVETVVALRTDSQVLAPQLLEESTQSIIESEKEKDSRIKEPQQFKTALTLTSDENTIVDKLTILTTQNETKKTSILMIGGAVRDRLAHPEATKKTNLDTEFLVQGPITLEEIQELFKEYHAKIVGSKVRHVTFKMNGHKYDILTTEMSLYDDFKKRHFTHSGLYFDVVNRIVLDFGNGMADIDQRLTRTINDPREVLANDSTILLLGFRITSKLDFTFDSEYKTAAQEQLTHLRRLSPQAFSQKITPNFLYAELNKILMSGHAKKIFDYFLSENLFDLYFPESVEYLKEGTLTWHRLRKLLISADKRVVNNQSNNAILILAVIFYEPFQQLFQEQKNLLTEKDKLSEVECFNRCVDKFFPTEMDIIAHRLINTYLRDKIRFIWLLNELRNEKTPGLLMKMDKSYSASDVLAANYFQALLAKEQHALNLSSQGLFRVSSQIPAQGELIGKINKEPHKVNKEQPEAPPKRRPKYHKEKTYPGTVFGSSELGTTPTLESNKVMELN
jgi:tRNA nucleotidyltransferase/poly(A) polymerase